MTGPKLRPGHRGQRTTSRTPLAAYGDPGRAPAAVAGELSRWRVRPDQDCSPRPLKKGGRWLIVGELLRPPRTPHHPSGVGGTGRPPLIYRTVAGIYHHGRPVAARRWGWPTPSTARTGHGGVLAWLTGAVVAHTSRVLTHLDTAGQKGASHDDPGHDYCQQTPATLPRPRRAGRAVGSYSTRRPRPERGRCARLSTSNRATST